MKARATKQDKFKAIGFAVRLLAVAIVIGSLLSMLAPLGAASSTHLCTMECCIGTAPHLAGACSTGWFKPAKHVQPPTEVLCGSPLSKIPPTKIQPVAIQATIRDEVPESCGMHAGSRADTGLSEAPGSKAPGPFVRTLSSPCSADCGACSASNTVNPRPREKSAIAWAGQVRPPTRSLSFRSFSSQEAALSGHYEQPCPRGPPASLS